MACGQPQQMPLISLRYSGWMVPNSSSFDIDGFALRVLHLKLFCQRLRELCFFDRLHDYLKAAEMSCRATPSGYSVHQTTRTWALCGDPAPQLADFHPRYRRARARAQDFSERVRWWIKALRRSTVGRRLNRLLILAAANQILRKKISIKTNEDKTRLMRGFWLDPLIPQCSPRSLGPPLAASDFFPGRLVPLYALAARLLMMSPISVSSEYSPSTACGPPPVGARSDANLLFQINRTRSWTTAAARLGQGALGRLLGSKWQLAAILLFIILEDFALVSSG
ncbi:hypothetical protein K438DRAFT_1760515 [Mycena galopus ATCC 62051]|nr:hypothetical protein K438DRAFT_1760515 [Mycena galopus ATCC 62051]